MNREVRELIREFLRAIDGLSLREAEAVTGVNRETIRRFRAGEYEDPRPETLRQIQAFLEVGRDPDDGMGYIQGLKAALTRVETLAKELRAAIVDAGGSTPSVDDRASELRALRKRQGRQASGEGEPPSQ